MRKGPPASNSSRQRLNIRHVHRDAFRLFQPACLGRFRRTTTMGISFFSPRQTGFSKTHYATARKRHGVAESNRCSGAVGRGGRLRAANACDHCGGRFGMVTHRCWGSKFCKKTCKASFLREFWGERNLPLLRLRPQSFGLRLLSTLPSNALLQFSWHCDASLRASPYPRT